MRRGELPPLTWDDVHVDNGVTFLNISKELLRSNRIVHHTKTYKDRDVPLSLFPKALDVLKRVELLHKQMNLDSKFIFWANTENGCITYDTVANFHNRMLRKLNIPTSRECMKGTHAYRRTVVNELRNKGANPQTVANILGQSVQVQESNYYTGGYDLEELKSIANG